MNEDQLLKTAKEIQAVSLAAEKRAKNKWDNIGKPIDGLGLFEDMFIRIAGIKDDENFSLKNKYIAVMCSDNGVVAEAFLRQTAVLRLSLPETWQREHQAYALCRDVPEQR